MHAPYDFITEKISAWPWQTSSREKVTEDYRISGIPKSDQFFSKGCAKFVAEAEALALKNAGAHLDIRFSTPRVSARVREEREGGFLPRV